MVQTPRSSAPFAAVSPKLDLLGCARLLTMRVHGRLLRPHPEEHRLSDASRRIGRRGLSYSNVKQPLTVVPANAGTHNHRPSLLRESRRTASFNTRDPAYGSLRSQGRRRWENARLYLPAMHPHPSLKNLPPEEGVGNARRFGAPAALRAKVKKHASKSPRVRRVTRHSRTRMVLTAYGALSLVIGLCCHHFRLRRRSVNAEVMPASRHQDHTLSPSASYVFVC